MILIDEKIGISYLKMGEQFTALKLTLGKPDRASAVNSTLFWLQQLKYKHKVPRKKHKIEYNILI